MYRPALEIQMCILPVECVDFGRDLNNCTVYFRSMLYNPQCTYRMVVIVRRCPTPVVVQVLGDVRLHCSSDSLVLQSCRSLLRTCQWSCPWGLRWHPEIIQYKQLLFAPRLYQDLTLAYPEGVSTGHNLVQVSIYLTTLPDVSYLRYLNSYSG